MQCNHHFKENKQKKNKHVTKSVLFFLEVTGGRSVGRYFSCLSLLCRSLLHCVTVYSSLILNVVCKFATVYRPATTLKPLTVEMNIDHVAVVQYSAWKP